jgi:hypothetical protein
MKRLAWLLLAVFCLAVAQVQPVEAVAQAKPKDCCDCSGHCRMPACPAPAAAQPSPFEAARPLTVARPQPSREAVATRCDHRKFFLSLLPPAARPASDPAPVVAPPASVPLFEAHCSYLI